MSEEREVSNRTIDVVEDTSVRVKTIMGGAATIILVITAAANEYNNFKRDIEIINTIALVRVDERLTELNTAVFDIRGDARSNGIEVNKRLGELKADTDKLEARTAEELRVMGSRINDIEERMSRMKLDLNKDARVIESHIKTHDDVVREMQTTISDLKGNVVELRGDLKLLGRDMQDLRTPK